MVASCVGRGRRRKCVLLATGGATVALLLLLHGVLQPGSADLTDVFYPATTPHEQHDPTSHNGLPVEPPAQTNPSSPRDKRGWLHVPPLPPLPTDGTIFLLETSGRSELTPREWCAVESAARAHPHHLTLLLTAAPRLQRSPLASSVLALKNTRLAQLRFAELFAGTDLEEWYRSRVVLRSWWQASHMSDAVRFVLLARFGGIYLDTDVIVRRSMAEMDDGAGLESEHAIAAGVLKFSRQSALPRQLAARFVNHYDPHDWGGNGPGVVTAVLLGSCGLGELPLPAAHCGQYTIFGSRRFYGVPWTEWRLLLEPVARDAVLERVDASYVVHTWALHTRGHPAPPGSAMYELADQHCPLALRHAGGRF